MQIKLRRLTPKDYSILIDLWTTAGLTSLRPNGRDSWKCVTEQIERDPDLFLGAFVDDVLVGACVGSDDGRKGWINRLTVMQSYRRKGIAGKLIAQIEATLRKRGRRIICALIEDWNNISIELFKKEGYTVNKDILYLSKRENEDV